MKRWPELIVTMWNGMTRMRRNHALELAGVAEAYKFDACRWQELPEFAKRRLVYMWERQDGEMDSKILR